jgi:hypothetical protein
MRLLFSALLCSLPVLAQAEACIVHARGDKVEVQLCQENRSIPAQLFRDGFCAPVLQGQTVSVEFIEQCPADSIGICRNARVGGIPYQQDIHYYGIASDARILEPACEQQYGGNWTAGKMAPVPVD